MQSTTETEYHKNGEIEKQTPYVDGKIHGIQKFFYANEQIMIEKSFIQGKQQGLEKHWNAQGALYDVRIMCNDEIIFAMWLEISLPNPKSWFFECHFSTQNFLESNVFLQIHMHFEDIPEYIPTNKPLFNKAQWKKICNQS